VPSSRQVQMGRGRGRASKGIRTEGAEQRSPGLASAASAALGKGVPSCFGTLKACGRTQISTANPGIGPGPRLLPHAFSVPCFRGNSQPRASLAALACPGLPCLAPSVRIPLEALGWRANGRSRSTRSPKAGRHLVQPAHQQRRVGRPPRLLGQTMVGASQDAVRLMQLLTKWEQTLKETIGIERG